MKRSLAAEFGQGPREVSFRYAALFSLDLKNCIGQDKCNCCE